MITTDYKPSNWKTIMDLAFEQQKVNQLNPSAPPSNLPPTPPLPSWATGGYGNGIGGTNLGYGQGLSMPTLRPAQPNDMMQGISRPELGVPSLNDLWNTPPKPYEPSWLEGAPFTQYYWMSPQEKNKYLTQRTNERTLASSAQISGNGQPPNPYNATLSPAPTKVPAIYQIPNPINVGVGETAPPGEKFLMDWLAPMMIPAGLWREPLTLIGSILPKALTNSVVGQAISKIIDTVIGKSGETRVPLERLSQNVADTQFAKDTAETLTAIAKDETGSVGKIRKIKQQSPQIGDALDTIAQEVKKAKVAPTETAKVTPASPSVPVETIQQKAKENIPETLHVYRGTNPSGSNDPGLYGKGTYFTTDKEYAKTYARVYKGQTPEFEPIYDTVGGKVIETDITLQHPYIVNTSVEIVKLKQPIEIAGLRLGLSDKELKRYIANELTNQLQAQGYDGVIIREVGLGVGSSSRSEVVVFPKPNKQSQQVVAPEPTPTVTAEPQAQKAGAGKPPVEPPTNIPPIASGKLPDEFAGNIRLNKYPEEVRPFLKEWADANPDVIASARRGIRSDAEVLADAQSLVDDVGGDFTKLQRKWKPGDAWNAEEVLALRGTLRAKTEAVLKAQQLASQSNSAENLIKLKLALEEQAAVQETVSGVTAEAGRALRQFRQQVFDASNNAGKLERLLKQYGGRDNIENMAKLLGELDINNPSSVNAFIRSLNKPGFWDYITEIYYNSILSGPKTHIVNSLSNTVNAIAAPIERGAAAIVDIPLSVLQGRTRARFFSEVPADAFGAIEGITEGFRSFGTTMKTGISPMQASKFEMQRAKAFTGIPGRVINFPSTALEAADALMKSINYRAAFNATAKRIISSSKNSKTAVEALAELKANPTKSLLAEAERITEERLFRASAGKTTQSLLNLRESLSIGGFKPLRFLIPFIRTPVNLVKYGLERSPFGWFNPKLWANIASKNPEAADQIGRAALGSIAAATIAWYVQEDKITGAAPTIPSQRDRFYRDGKQPYSIKIGDTWISYQRLEPFNQSFASVAAAIGALKDNEKDAVGKAVEASNTIAQNMVSQTYLSGLATLVNAIAQPEQYASSLLSRFGIALVIPASSLTRTAAQITDTTVRQPETFAEEVKAGIPGLSEQVPSKLTAFGKDVTRTSPAWSPINISPSKETPLTKELDRLEINTGFVGDSINGITLTKGEQRNYQILAGQNTEKLLTALINKTGYKRLTEKNKKKVINSAVNDARGAARRVILKGIPSKERTSRLRNGLPQEVPMTPAPIQTPVTPSPSMVNPFR